MTSQKESWAREREFQTRNTSCLLHFSLPLGIYRLLGIPRRRKTTCSPNLLAISANFHCFRFYVKKFVCPVNFVSSKSTRLLSRYTCLFFTCFTSRRLIITMQASDAEVVILEDSLINLNCVDLAFVGGSSKQFM